MKSVIGISVANAASESTEAVFQLVEQMGAEPYIVDQHANHDVENDIKQVCAWILMGNDFDIDPSCYIHRYKFDDPNHCIHPCTISELATPQGHARARYEEALISAIIKTNVPMMGVCGGMQRINVMLGGTLHQHLPDWVGDDRHCQKTRGVDPRVAEIPILIEMGTTLAEIANGMDIPFILGCDADMPKVLYENSIHHQAVDRVAEGFRRCCVTDVVCKDASKNGYIVKGIEVDPAGQYAGKFILGLQWHPEFCASALSMRIMQRFMLEVETQQY